MLDHFKRELLRNIENLAGLPALQFLGVVQIAPTASARPFGLVHDPPVGPLHALKM